MMFTSAITQQIGVLNMKKVVKIIILVFVLIAGYVTYFLCTHMTYWHNVKWDYPLFAKPDTEYLDIWDLRLLNFTSQKDRLYLEALGTTLVNSSYKNNGVMQKDFEGIISEIDFEEINPRRSMFSIEHTKTVLDTIIDEDFDLTETDVLQHGNKAIFFFCFKYHAKYNPGETEIDDTIAHTEAPDRIYFEYKNGKWVVKDIHLESHNP